VTVAQQPKLKNLMQAGYGVSMTSTTIFGAGSWGTAIGYLLSQKDVPVTLWGRDAEQLAAIKTSRVNEKYLPNVTLPQTLSVEADVLAAAKASTVWIMAVPSFAMRELFEQIKTTATDETIVINLAKGLEAESNITMSQVLEDVLPQATIFTLSGPSHAEEVGLDYPTSVVIAGKDLEKAKQLQELFTTNRFRPYISDDILGVEYGSVVKNVIAIAAGILHGLGFGDNAMGALISRGLAELVKLGVHLGTHRETLFGLSGLGDLVTTATSQHSRNRRVGELLGQGQSLEYIMDHMNMVAEGVFATKTVYQLAHEHGVEMPITEACYAVLYENASPLEKVTELMNRQLKEERL
jgi:glycerol-3-phosphate dehydrogenase (NAD(P)+)